MAKPKPYYLWVLLTTFLFSTILILHQASGLTDPSDVVVLQDLYKSLNQPPHLVGWNLSGGDPCEESWTGISCSGTSVMFIKLNGLDLNGSLGGNLFNLFNLKQLDVSFNHIEGEIPSSLPPNATHIDLSFINFNQNIPFSLTSMKYLRHLNLSHNSLSGPVGNVFMGLPNLKRMDLSYNNFTGDLPSSFGSLSNLTGLFLQNNQFTGSVVFLAYLPLTDLNIQNNHFSGIVPKQFENIPNLWFGENAFQIGADYPPWSFPTDNIPTDQNVENFPKAQSNAIESYPIIIDGKQKHRRLTPGAIAFTVGGIALVATCAAALLAIHIKRSHHHKLEDLESNHNGYHSPLSTATVIESSFAESEEHLSLMMVASPPVPRLRRVASVNFNQTEKFNGRRQSRRQTVAKTYTLSELQLATNSFSKDNLLGEGSVGSVYKAQFTDGQIYAARVVDTVALSLHEEDHFFNIIQNVARLRHPNIVTLTGYCIENGQHILVYEYVKNWSLENELHCNDQHQLPWHVRLNIALGIARALDYLHSESSPPVAHNNLKAANVLLDDEFRPHLCDSGLAVLRPFTGNTTKLKASELAVSYSGYSFPDNGSGRVDCTKGDIFAFGVLLLELLTGRKAYDSTRAEREQYLVRWASYRMHNYGDLEEMVDPRIISDLSSKVLSQFADIISLCIQPEAGFRATMSEIVDSLVHLVERNLDDTESIWPGLCASAIRPVKPFFPEKRVSMSQLQKRFPRQAAGPNHNFPTLSIPGGPNPQKPRHVIVAREPSFRCLSCDAWVVDVAETEPVFVIFGLPLLAHSLQVEALATIRVGDFFETIVNPEEVEVFLYTLHCSEDTCNASLGTFYRMGQQQAYTLKRRNLKSGFRHPTTPVTPTHSYVLLFDLRQTYL